MVEGRLRPADLALAHWSHGQDAAVDPTVIHSLNPSHPWDPSRPAVDQAEAAKHAKSDAPFAAADMVFIPVAEDTFGAYGQEGQRFLAQLFSRYAKRHGLDLELSCPGRLQAECWQRVAVALRKAVAAQLSGCFLQAGGAWASPFTGADPDPPPDGQ